MREMEQAAPPYFLSRHAHICVANDAMVFLDLVTGKYLSIDRRIAASLGSLVLDWPLQSDPNRMPALLQSLVDRHLLTRDPRLGKSAACAVVELPRHWIREGGTRGCPDITARDIYRFMASVAYAGYSRTFLPFSHTASRARKRSEASKGSEVNIEQLASLVRVFDWLRPMGFKKSDECFLYCLAMREFLSKYGIVPSWVFGVRTGPFAAHCWLQCGDQVLTDIPFNLRRMVPILVL